MKTEARIGQFLSAWTGLVTRHAWAVVIFFVLFAAMALYYTVTHIGINTDTENMLDEKLPYRQTLKTYKQAFPNHLDVMLLVVDGKHPVAVEKAAKRLAEKLAGEKQAFKSVYLPGTGEFFDKNGLLYLPTSELKKLARDLGRSGLMLSELKRTPTAGKLLSIIPVAAVGSVSDDQGGDIGPLLDDLNRSLTAYRNDQSRPLQWESIFPTGSLTRTTRVIIVQPILDFKDLLAAGKAISTIREQARELGIDAQHDLRLRVTGEAALAYDEMKSVSQGMGLAGIMALILVIAVLWLGTGSLRILIFSIVALLIGLCLTAGFATLSVGSLNLISIAFAVLYIGLGIDFSIHLSLRYEELLKQKIPNLAALRESSRDVGVSLVICAVSTAVGFYAFIPTQFIGVSELGIISGTGMFISLFVSLTLLPALFAISPMPVKKIPAMEYRSVLGYWSDFPLRHGKPILIATALLVAGSLYLMPRVHFDYDLLNLRDQSSESVATFRDLVKGGDFSPLRLTVLAENDQQARALRQKLLQLPSVERVFSLEELVPADQDAKLKIIRKLKKRLKIVTRTQAKADARTTLDDLLAADEAILLALKENPSSLDAKLEQLHQQLTAVIARLKNLSADAQQAALQKLDRELMGTFPSVLDKLQTIIQARRIELASLPEHERAHWVSPVNQARMLMVFAKKDLRDVHALREFVQQVSSVADKVTDIPAISLAAGDAAVQAFQQAFVTAFLLIFLLLMLLMKNIRDTILVLTPLILAGLFTAAAAVLFDIPFNFANIIALPLLLGIGVDNGIHMVSRARHSHTSSRNLLQTSTARAVILSALTTVGSFGNLAYSSHPGTASMGQLLTLGVFLTMVCTLVILPVLLAWRFDDKAASA